jgi:hypothetical protein
MRIFPIAETVGQTRGLFNYRKCFGTGDLKPVELSGKHVPKRGEKAWWRLSPHTSLNLKFPIIT